MMQAHCQSPSSQRYNQSFVKELANPTLKKNCYEKFADTKKIKNADTRADRKEESKMTMTRKLNNDNGLQDCKIEHQAVTCGASHAGFQPISELIAPLPSVFSGDSDSRPNPARKRTTHR